MTRHSAIPAALAVTVILALLLPAPARCAWAPLFRSAELYDVSSWEGFNPLNPQEVLRGGIPASVKVGDLNEDGRPDLVVTNRYRVGLDPESKVSVLLHSDVPDASPLFLPHTTYAAGLDFPTSLVLADMNLDGHLDAVTGGNWDSVSVLLGDGHGTLGTPSAYDTDPEYSGSGVAYGLAVADLNSDSWPDVVAGTDSNGEGIAVLLGTGNGALGTPVQYFVSGTPLVRGIAMGDVTGDGAVDVVVVGEFGVVIMGGNGTGTLTPVRTINLSGLIRSPVICEINGDALPDIVVARSTGPLGVFVLLGTGGGNFATAPFNALAQNPNTLALVDVDGNGVLDIVSGGQEAGGRNSVAVCRGNGNGTFGSASYYGVGHFTGPTCVADVDLNGRPDVVAAEYHCSTCTFQQHMISVLRDDGAGGFQASAWSLEGRRPFREALADFNRDGKVDVAFSDSTTIGVGLGDGTGTFTYMLGGNLTAPATSTIVTGDWQRDGRPDIAFQRGNDVVGWFGVGTGGFSIVPFTIPGYTLHTRSSGDMNRDGRLDFVVTASATVRVHIQSADGFTYTPSAPSTASGTVLSLAVGDWDGDGKLDVAVARVNGVSVFRGNGDGTLQAEQILDSGHRYRDICTADFNRDGKPDLAAVEELQGLSNSRGATVFLGNGLGGFGAPTTFRTLERAGFNIDSWDTDVDGNPDLILSGIADPSQYGTYRPGSLEVLLGDGSGGFTFGTGRSLGALRVGAQDLAHFVAGDVNRDGLHDIVAPAVTNPQLVVGFQTHLGIPPPRSPLLAPRTELAMSPSANRVAVGDLNRDGVLDIVTASASSQVSVRLGGTSGTYGPAVTVGSSLSARQVGLGDFDRDGILDIVTARSTFGSPENVAFLKGNGDGTFGASLSHSITGVADFAIGDMNADGKLDIVVGQADPPTFVKVLIGNGDGTFTAAAGQAVTRIRDIELADVDRDGYLDVVLAGAYLQTLHGNGNGTLNAPTTIPVGTTSVGLVSVADFDRDGYPDIVLSDLTSRVVVAWGSSGFTSQVVTPLPSNLWDLQTAPAAADGRQILYATTTTNRLLVLTPTATPGAFAIAADYDAGGNPETLALADLDRDGALDALTANSTTGVVSLFLHAKSLVTGTPEIVASPRAMAHLRQNSPNPFNPVTTIRFDVNQGGKVLLAVYDLHGRIVRTLLDDVVATGDHRVRWDGTTDHGERAASGVYFYRLRIGSDYQESRRMVMLK